jgi:hypothetical protein
VERFYVTVHIIDRQCISALRDVAELNRVTIDHVSRIQGYGDPVICEERPFLRYGSSLIEIGSKGVLGRDSVDYELTRYPRIEIPDRMEPEVENRVTERVGANVLRCGSAPLANHPASWGEG